MHQATKMVIGCGYLGRRVAECWSRSGARVLVSTRRLARAEELSQGGLEPVVMDVSRPETFPVLPPLDTLLFAVAYDPQSGPSREAVTIDGLRHVLNAVKSLSNRFIYISTTGVYGQREGEWVDETSRCEPQRVAGQCYLDAEQLLQSHAWGAQSLVLRLAGIYGPDRIPFLDRLRTGQKIPVDPEGYLNLIHVDDAVSLILASEAAPAPNLFVVSDGQPVHRGEYYREVARRLGTEPKFCQPIAGSPASERAQSSKRINNAKMRRELKVDLRYPDYLAGLSAILGG